MKQNEPTSARRLPARWLAAAFAAVALAAASAAEAALVITVGNVQATQGQASVVVPVTVTGGDLVSDAMIALQVGNGGTVTGNPRVPSVSAFDLGTSIFQGLASGFSTSSAFAPPDEIVDLNIVANASGQSVAASGTLLNFTLDLTGVAPAAGSQYALSLADSFGTTTRLLGPGGATYPTTLVAGSLSIVAVPEPTAIAGVGLIALVALRRRVRA